MTAAGASQDQPAGAPAAAGLEPGRPLVDAGPTQRKDGAGRDDPAPVG